MNQERLYRWSNIALATFVGVALFIGGYLLVVNEGHDAYGLVIFLLLPLIVGFAIGAVGRRGLNILAALALTTVLSLGLLIVLGFEGWICCLMALPLLVVPMGIGVIVGYFVYGKERDRKRDATRTALMLLIVCPFLMAAAGEVERPWRNTHCSESIVSEISLATPPEEVWEQLVRMSTMEGDKSFLLQIGLPVPYRCTLNRDAIGGRRTCYFNQGEIEMEVTDWHRPRSIAMRISKSTLPGRKWLRFVDASYELIPEGDATRVIRHTTIASKLYPRWYWRPFEKWGVKSEHEFVLSSLAKSVAVH